MPKSAQPVSAYIHRGRESSVLVDVPRRALIAESSRRRALRDGRGCRVVAAAPVNA